LCSSKCNLLCAHIKLVTQHQAQRRRYSTMARTYARTHTHTHNYTHTHARTHTHTYISADDAHILIHPPTYKYTHNRWRCAVQITARSERCAREERETLCMHTYVCVAQCCRTMLCISKTSVQACTQPRSATHPQTRTHTCRRCAVRGQDAALQPPQHPMGPHSRANRRGWLRHERR
jgi:hypothetical protein